MKQHKAIFTWLTCILITSFLLFSCAIREEQLQERILWFEQPAETWDEAIPLGNGMLGALIWQKDNNLRFSLDRADLWDLRPMFDVNKPEFCFNWVQQQVKNNNYKAVQDLFDAPYDQSPAPSKIPGAALEFNTQNLGKTRFVKLTLDDALCEIGWQNGTTLKTFIHASLPFGWFSFEGVPEEFIPVLVVPQYQKQGGSGIETPVEGQDLQRLGYQQGKVNKGPCKLTYRQKGWNGFEYEVAVTWKYSGNTLSGIWSISSSFSEEEGDKTAEQLVEQQMNEQTFDSAFRVHEKWWETFWNKSGISIPDSVLERQWYLEQYKFGAIARTGAPPISLQAVWTADNGKLPPWKGDFHHDINTEMSYWPSYSSNHIDLEEGFINWLWTNRETFKEYTRNYFGTAGLNVPGVTTLTGEPMGGWIQYSLGPTVGAWLAHHFYLHWKYTGDRNFLHEKAYPWLKDVAIYLDEISEKDEKGFRKLPLSSSPEVNNNSINAWFTQTTNFDLALIRWTYQKAEEMAEELEKKEDASRWRAILKEWPDFALDSAGGLAIAPDIPYSESHRHFSHLMAYHPLGLIDVSNDTTEKDIIAATIQKLEEKGTNKWIGFSFSWMGSIYARAFMGDKAAESLRIFAESFCLPNSFHANGDQSGKGYSDFRYRPFTLEGNFAFAAGINEMLLQSHSGVINIFPAIPKGWENISFYQLRAEGAFLVSAEMKNAKIEEVIIHSEKGGIAKIKNPFKAMDFNSQVKIDVKNNVLILNMKKGEKVILKAG